MSSTVGIGAALGLPIAAMVVQYASWHVMFWGTTAVGALGTALAWWAVRESPVREPGRFDMTGALGLALGLSCLLLGVSQGGQWGWSSPRILGLFVGSVCVLGLWWAQQLRAARPLVDLKLATSPRVALPHVAALLMGFAFYANSLVTAQLVQAPKATGYGLELSIVATGLVMLPGGVIMLLLAGLGTIWRPACWGDAGPRHPGHRRRLRHTHHQQPQPAGDPAGFRGLRDGNGVLLLALPTLILRAVPAGRPRPRTASTRSTRSTGWPGW